MSEASVINYLVAVVFGFLLALVLVSVLRRRERARGMVIEQGASPLATPPVLAPLRRRSTLEIGRELAPEVERLILAGDKPAAVELIRQRAGLDREAAERTVEIMERLL